MDVSPDTERGRLLAAADADLAGVEAALGRLEDGTAFVCASCGGPLTEERLAASPLSDRCATCDDGP